MRIDNLAWQIIPNFKVSPATAKGDFVADRVYAPAMNLKPMTTSFSNVVDWLGQGVTIIRTISVRMEPSANYFGITLTV